MASFRLWHHWDADDFGASGNGGSNQCVVHTNVPAMRESKEILSMSVAFRMVRGLVILACLLLSAGSFAMAESEGQEDLDQAIEAKLSAETVSDLNKVIKLCDSALGKGLDKDNAAFAKKLLGSTLLQRAQILVRPVLQPWPNETQSLRRIVQLRAIVVSDVKRALEYDPDQPMGHLLLGQLYAQPGGDRKKARASLDEAIRLGKDAPQIRARALAARAPLRESADKALADFDEAIHLAPRNAKFVRDRGLYRIQHGDVDKGLADLDRSLELNPSHVETLEARAVALGMQDNYEQALASLDKAIRLDPKRASAYYHRGRIRLAMKDFKGSIEDLNHALELQSGLAAALLARAEAYRQLGDLKKALADLDTLHKAAPNSDLVRRLRHQLMVQSGRADEAIAETKQWIERQDKPRSKGWIELGTLYLLADDPTHAVEAFSSAIEAAPDSGTAYLRRADAYVQIGHHAEAVADYQKALEHDPENVSALNNFSWLLSTSPHDELRDGKRAIEIATKACRVTDYKQAYILSTLAAGYAETGDFDTAIKWSKKAVEIGGPNLHEALEKELKQYQSHEPWREEKPGAPLLSSKPDEAQPSEDNKAPENKTDDDKPAEKEAAAG